MPRRHGIRLLAIVAVATVTAVTALTVSASRPGDAAYPGANGRIAYAYGENYGYGAIWSANSDGSAPTPLTGGAADSSPAYSPDGNRVAFQREAGVAVMNADGSGVTQLLSGDYSVTSKVKWASEYETPEKPSETIPFVKITTYTEKWLWFNGPSFSPDGSQLAVGESRGEEVFTVVCEVEEEEGSTCVYGYEGGYFNYEEECVDCVAHIVTVNASTGAVTGEVTHTSEETADYEPSYSPGGEIAFTRWIESGGYSIFAVSSPGAAPTRVTNGHEDYAPDFSPDGSKIAFSHSGEIALVGAGGGSIAILPAPLPLGAWWAYSESPAFSPDGSKIAFEHVVYPKIGTTERGVYTMGIDGSGVTKIADKASAPSWQPLAVSPPPPPPPPVLPKARSRKGKVRLDKKGRARVGAIVCGSSPCQLKVRSAKLKAGKKQCKVKATVARRLASSKTAKVGVKVAGKCLRALKRAGRGRLIVRVRAIDAVGGHALTLRATLLAPKAHKRHRGKGHR